MGFLGSWTGSAFSGVALPPFGDDFGAEAGNSCGCAICMASSAWSAAESVPAGASGPVSAGNYPVSALLPSGTPRWNQSAALGTPVTVTYSFMAAIPWYASYGSAFGFEPMSETQKAAARLALATWADVANIRFVEVADSSNFGDGGQIRFGQNYQYSSSGFGYYPSTWPSGGDIYIAKNVSANTSPIPGDRGFLTLVHEVGHAIGLKHPGNYDSSGDGTEGPYLSATEDTNRYSIMSYNRQDFSDYNTYVAAPALYDVAAVQYLYGANTGVRAGDDTYRLDNTGSAFTKVIWDGGGTDTIDAGAQTRRVIIDLRDGKFSSIGTDGYSSGSWWSGYSYGDAVDNVSIAMGAVIENAIGGSGADTLTGNDSANYLNGGTGNDTLYGGAGFDVLVGGAGSDTLDGGTGGDTAVWSRPRRACTVTLRADGNDTVSDGSGTDTLVGNTVEVLQFTDGRYVTDSTSAAAQVYRLYNATLGRTPDAGGLNGWSGALETGQITLAGAAAGFVGSAEFAQRYGQPTNAGFVTLLYNNVLGRAPDASGYAGWLSALNGGMARADAVLGFSESAENVARHRTTVERGLWMRDDDATAVARMYYAALNRMPDSGGLALWTGYLKSGRTISDVAQGFIGSAEFIQRYGSTSNQQFVTLLYRNVLSREPDGAGLSGWLGTLDAGTARASVVVGFSESEEHRASRSFALDNGIYLSDFPSGYGPAAAPETDLAMLANPPAAAGLFAPA